MFQYGDNEINSYNSLSMNQSNIPEIKSSKLYSSSKVLINNDLAEKMKKTQINTSKKVILNINNVNGNNILNIENGGNINNENNGNINPNNNKSEEIDINEKTISSQNLTKLPKITKYAMPTNSI